MKKFVRQVSFGLCLSVLCCIGACQQKTEGVTAEAEVETTNAADSAYFALDSAMVICTIYADLPDSALRSPVGEWLDEQLGGYYTGDMADLQAMVDFYGQAWEDTLRQQLREIRSGVPVGYDARMEKTYETDKFVTYTMTTFINLGGAHPSTLEGGATFRKSDGKRLTWDIIRHDQEYLLADVKREVLKAYFDCKTDAELELMMDDIYDIPTPQTPPYFLQDGVMLVYQQYEIAGYAAGLPGGTVSYHKLEPLMTEQAKKLIP